MTMGKTARAQRNGHGLEQEARGILKTAALEDLLVPFGTRIAAISPVSTAPCPPMAKLTPPQRAAASLRNQGLRQFSSSHYARFSLSEILINCPGKMPA